jgi:tRNA nucleotidyltransferase/poly(A) polymerase
MMRNARMISYLSPRLHELRKRFQQQGFDLRLVGGCVRDWCHDPTGWNPSDIDLCTDATPIEQETIFEAHAIRHVATGLSHGTWTVVLDRPYEITSLRVEHAHDGRHAEVAWTRDWLADLSRRDLTINAMAMSFDGDLIDPFGGAADLIAKRVRFVGRAADRMREDYLRILRFFRFQGRFGSKDYDDEALAAAVDCAPGLLTISRERVWSEIAKIIGHSPMLLLDIIDCDVARYISLPGKTHNLIATHAASHATHDPASLMARYLGDETAVKALAVDWKWSANDRDQAMFIARNVAQIDSLHAAKLRIAVDEAPKYWVAETLRVTGLADAQAIIEWTVPSFPVGGGDLLALGMSGVRIGQTLKDLKTRWGESQFRLDKTQLIESLTK